LDEPLTGLDAGSARLVKDVLLNRVAEGCTVILTTHILEVAERMAQRIGVIAEGRLVAEGTLEELRAANHASHGGRNDTPHSLEEIFLDVVARSADASEEEAA
jgi:ABC-2 type transport system ATP-binding protein